MSKSAATDTVRVSASRVQEMLKHRASLQAIWETLNRQAEQIAMEIKIIDLNIEAEKRSVTHE